MNLWPQERQSGHQMQGRDKSMPHVVRSSMSDPSYFPRSSMSDPVYLARSSMSDPEYTNRNLVTPQVNVPEGALLLPNHTSLRISLACHSLFWGKNRPSSKPPTLLERA